MPHKPPTDKGRLFSNESVSDEGVPITVTGEPNKITITRPYFFVDQVEPVKIGRVPVIVTTNKAGDTFKSTITRVVVTNDVTGEETTLSFKFSGKCKVEIFFDHP